MGGHKTPGPRVPTSLHICSRPADEDTDELTRASWFSWRAVLQQLLVTFLTLPTVWLYIHMLDESCSYHYLLCFRIFASWGAT